MDRGSPVIGFTLGRYFSMRFLETILAVFIAISGLSFLIDFVEMLRRAGDVPGARPSIVALLSFLRVPSVSEQILPFAVLFGTMAAFVNLTRKLELVIARASGVSVWGFLVPPILIATLLGLVSITLYNPLAADLKQRADQMETELFGRPGSDKDSSIWIRQRSVDGKATLRADKIIDGGRTLIKVLAYLDDSQGRFIERVEADRATLASGAWQLANATVVRQGEQAETVGTYLLATDLTPEDVLQSAASPESVPFWNLPAIEDRTELAGLDATQYRLHYQSLLARPLLLVAMVLVAAAFSLRFVRFGGIGRMVASGVVAGFVLYVVTKLVANMGGAGLLSAPVAAWSPALVGSLLGALALLHQEDG